MNPSTSYAMESGNVIRECLGDTFWHHKLHILKPLFGMKRENFWFHISIFKLI